MVEKARGKKEHAGSELIWALTWGRWQPDWCRRLWLGGEVKKKKGDKEAAEERKKARDAGKAANSKGKNND